MEEEKGEIFVLCRRGKNSIEEKFLVNRGKEGKGGNYIGKGKYHDGRTQTVIVKIELRLLGQNWQSNKLRS